MDKWNCYRIGQEQKKSKIALKSIWDSDTRIYIYIQYRVLYVAVTTIATADYVDARKSSGSSRLKI